MKVLPIHSIGKQTFPQKQAGQTRFGVSQGSNLKVCCVVDRVIVHGIDPYSDMEPRSIYIAFRPEQIKSATDNLGTFDPNDPRISYNRSPR